MPGLILPFAPGANVLAAPPRRELHAGTGTVADAQLIVAERIGRQLAVVDGAGGRELCVADSTGRRLQPAVASSRVLVADGARGRSLVTAGSPSRVLGADGTRRRSLVTSSPSPSRVLEVTK